MSLFYFALNSIKSYTNLLDINENKNPSINDLEKGTKALCEIPWSKLSNEYKDNDKYTDAGTLPFRCFQLSYILVLLHEGYGFSSDSHNVHFVGNVNGGEVEWSLGVGLISGNNDSNYNGNNGNGGIVGYNLSGYIYYLSLLCGICASGCLWYSIYDKCQSRRKKSYQLIPVKVSDVDLL